MKTLLKSALCFAFPALFILNACTNKGVVNPVAKTYTSNKGTVVTLTTDQWYVTRFATGGGGTVNLKLEGTTNADKIVLQGHGDGLITDNELKLTPAKKFSSDGAISFTATSVPAGNFTAGTRLTAYKGSDVFVVELVSGELHY